MNSTEPNLNNINEELRQRIESIKKDCITLKKYIDDSDEMLDNLKKHLSTEGTTDSLKSTEKNIEDIEKNYKELIYYCNDLKDDIIINKSISYGEDKNVIVSMNDTYQLRDWLEEIDEKSDEETKTKIEAYSGKEVTLFRPPYGAITSSRAKDSGYPIILWNVDSLDWVYKSRSDNKTAEENIKTIADNIISQVEDGDIILMHEIYRNSYEAACIVIDTLSAEGYKFVTVSELIGEENLKVGVTYYNAE